MSMLRLLYDRLTAEAEVSSLVSDRVYFANAPQNITADMIVLRHVSTIPQHVFRGRGGCADNSTDVHCLSTTYLGVERLAAAVCAAIDGKVIAFDGEQYVIEVESDEDLPADTPAGRQAPVAYGRTLSLRVFQTEQR